MEITMKKIVIILFLIMLTGNVLATAQFPDILVYKGKTHSIFTNPLESYFDNQHPRPKDVFKVSCTANWRGYVATWKIEENNLYLVKLIEGSCFEDAPEIPIITIFPEQQVPVKASWFSGTLKIPLGERLQYVHMGYESIYEKELFLNIEDGKLVNGKLVCNQAIDGSCTDTNGSTQAGIDQCKANPNSCGITVSESSTSVSDDCMANYSISGQLHIPCVSVPDAFGGATVYEIIMNQQTGSFTFDLDMGSVKPR
jgi:hypothetical protein